MCRMSAVFVDGSMSRMPSLDLIPDWVSGEQRRPTRSYCRGMGSKMIVACEEGLQILVQF